MKHEWRKHEKDLYLPKQTPELVRVPEQKFIMINGKGNPNSEDFSLRIAALYPIVYAIRMMPRQGFTPPGYYEYTVYPLEGVWDLSEEGCKLSVLDKNELLYTIMIRQPEFVSQDVFDMALDKVKRKQMNDLLDCVEFKTVEAGLFVQMLHVGRYDTEAQTFKLMKEYIDKNNLEIVTLVHREIYLSDARRVDPEKYKTVLRYEVKYEDKEGK